MIFCEKCYRCKEKSVLEHDSEFAKRWWSKFHVKYIFSCGAYYHPEKGYAEVYAGQYCLRNRY